MGKKVFVDLSHPFSAEIPRWPYFDKPVIDNTHTMAPATADPRTRSAE